ncbi:MAG: hypothetical protein ACLRFI_00025 [Alphaproteobacteria bacterium]
MKKNDIVNFTKNAVGTMFLLAGAFFVCSTLLSMRSVFADPIAPMTNSVNTKTGRTTTNPRSVAGPRDTKTRSVVSRSTNVNTVQTNKESTAVKTRSNVGTSARGVGSRNVVSRSNRNDVSNANAISTNRSIRARNTTSAKKVVSRNAAEAARVSLQGSAIRGSKTTNTAYNYLSSKLYTGNYSNIIDSTTGLISADAYSTCLESYYTCMDEICTARSAAKRRCSCAARVTNFIQAEEALEKSNEELIKVSGELALLVATKGKDVSAAFQLTDAEKVMNCVSYKEEKQKADGDKSNQDSIMTTWCQSHNIYDASKCSYTVVPSYCSTNNFGFDIDDIEGSSSDILASLKAWADAKDNATSYIQDNNSNLLQSYSNISGLVNDMTGIVAKDTSDVTIDSLANTWGYDLFERAHNDVCSRVLDSCFNGIYEGCGTPPSGGKCTNGASSSCPFNYNSKIKVASNGEVELNERGSSSATLASSASCFGYTSTSGDPYSDLRGPVADARRSIMQKYLLDANADCDTFGEELKATAQNVAYQKEAAKQALQQKRMDFYNEEQQERITNARNAITNFNECISEIWDCYEEMSDEENWTTARIKTYCAQVSNVPHCYEPMICIPTEAQFLAVIDTADSASCNFTQDYKTNTCRNLVTLSEILSPVVKPEAGKDITKIILGTTERPSSNNSAEVREYCLEKALGCGVGADSDSGGKSMCLREWKKENFSQEGD